MFKNSQITNRSLEKVSIEILDNTITEKSVVILITDNNENSYSWNVEFGIQKKINNKWVDLKYVSDDLSWIDIAYILNENNQLTQRLNIEQYYGKLSTGTYRIVKFIDDGKSISNLYSNEFEIK